MDRFPALTNSFLMASVSQRKNANTNELGGLVLQQRVVVGTKPGTNIEAFKQDLLTSDRLVVLATMLLGKAMIQMMHLSVTYNVDDSIWAKIIGFC